MHLCLLLILLDQVLSIRIYISSLERTNNTEPMRQTLDEQLVRGLREYHVLNTGTRMRREDHSRVKPIHDVSNMSKNITLVLENLLKNYESSQLPSHGKDEPTVIRTNMLIRSMGPVSELDMDYSMDCYFRQYWRDSRLSFLGPIKSLSLSIKMLERIWRPDTYFYNGKQSYVHTITVPNKLLRISQEGDILYSMRLTIKANCPMELRNFPMDSQSCPLVLGSYAYTSKNLIYQWQTGQSVSFVPGMTLSQFDLMGSPQRNLTVIRRKEPYSVLQVNFNLQRNTGYFVIQVYVPCILIVVLSWVSFWIHREATSDRVGLGITTVLTLSTISLDSRTDLPKVRYATALDWFLLMSFFYCIATLLEFAGVHYFTKVGSGEIPVDEEEWEDAEEVELLGYTARELAGLEPTNSARMTRRRSSLICPIYNEEPKASSETRRRRSLTGAVEEHEGLPTSAVIQIVSNDAEVEQAESFSLSVKIRSIEVIETGSERKKRLLETSQSSGESYQTVGGVLTSDESRSPDWKSRKYDGRKMVERQTQTERKIPKWRQFVYCLLGNDSFRRQRQREAAKIEGSGKRHVNSVSHIDQAARVLFPLSFASLNLFYWVFYLYTDNPRAVF